MCGCGGGSSSNSDVCLCEDGSRSGSGDKGSSGTPRSGSVGPFILHLVKPAFIRGEMCVDTTLRVLSLREDAGVQHHAILVADPQHPVVQFPVQVTDGAVGQYEKLTTE